MISFPDARTKKISFKRLSAFYGNISMMANAGIALDAIFLNFSRTEPDSIHRQQFQILANKLKHGQDFVATLQQINLLPEFDIPLLKASIAMGRIPQLTKKLSKQYEDLHRSLSEIKSQMFNPVFTLTLAVFIGDFAELIADKITTMQYLFRTLPSLFFVFAAVGFFYWVWQQSQYSRVYRKYFYSTFGVIPGLKNYILSLAIQRFSLAFELAIETGLDLYKSLDLAGESSGYEKVRIATKRLVPMIQEGVSLDSALKVETVFPKEFVIAIDLGINSGNLPESIMHYRVRLEIEIEKTRGLIVRIIPRIIQVAVAMYVISMIVGFWGRELPF